MNMYRPVDIMIVDDTPANLELLAGMLKQKGYRVRSAPNGKLALQSARNDPPDLILLDISMPDMNGFEVCAELKADKRMSHIPVIFLSALADVSDKVRAFAAGGVDYITKPFQFEEVQARVATHLNICRLKRQVDENNLMLVKKVESQIKEISESQLATIFALAKLSEARDDVTGSHLERVQAFCRLLAVQMSGLEKYAGLIDRIFIDTLFITSPLHDIGKVNIPDSIILKPGPLTQDEFAYIKLHPLVGAHTLESVRQYYPQNLFINMAIEVARSHHERWDGAGYPDGLAGEAIPLNARIMAVADVYDALRSERSYKRALSHEASVNIIFDGQGSQFDPGVVEAFGLVQDQMASLSQELSSGTAQRYRYIQRDVDRLKYTQIMSPESKVETAPSVMIVDDSPADLDLLSGALKEDGFRVRAAPGGKIALLSVQQNPPDLIVLDICMPEMDGYEVCRLLKENWKTRDIPIIFLTSMEEQDQEARGLALGAVDFLSKPVNLPIVRARIRNQLQLKLHRDILEQRVGERTAQLEVANQTLQTEIDEHRMTVAALIMETEKLAVALSLVGAGVIAIDKSGLICTLNVAGEEIIGWTREEATGQRLCNILEICDEDGNPLGFESVEEIYGIPGRLAERNVSVLFLNARDGTRKYVSLDVVPISANAEPDGGLVVIKRLF